MVSGPRISIVIPTYNRSDLLQASLEALTAQTLPPEQFEVIVSDDGSSDDTAEVARSFAGKLRLKYHFQEDLGFRAAAARNAGARLAEAPVLVFVDTGVLPGPEFAAAHLRAHEDTDARGRAVIGFVLGYPTPFNDNPDYKPVEGLDELLKLYPLEEIVERYRDDPAFRDPRYGELEKLGFDLSARLVPEELYWSGNCSVTAAHYWAVGGYDEDYQAWGLEDSDLGFRLARHGVGFRFSADAWTVEMPHDRDDAANFESLLKNAMMFLEKHRFSVPTLEFLYLFMVTGTTGLTALESANRSLADWADECQDLDVVGELEQAFAELPAGTSVAVFGAGPTIPSNAPGGVLADFDPQVVERLRAAAEAAVEGEGEGSTGRYDVRYNLGIRLALPDESVDVVLLTSRLSGMWEKYGEAILAEAGRIGRRVEQLFPAPAPAPASDSESASASAAVSSAS